MKCGRARGVIFTIICITGLMVHSGCKEDSLIENPLANGRWILESIQYSSQNIVTVDEDFWILFKTDFTLEMQVDCNFCTGSYQLDEDQGIAYMTPTGCTEMFCGPDSKDEEFLDALETASSYERVGNGLRIYFTDEGARLNFISE